MPWMEATTVSSREVFVDLVGLGGIPFSEQCRRAGVSRKTGYKWLGRYRQAGPEGLADRSRRPARSPRQSSPGQEAAVVGLHDQQPTWGPRKLAARLRMLDEPGVPHPNTIRAILGRHGRTVETGAAPSIPHQRFERQRPNELWQMDFKGHVPLGADGRRLHPLTVLDDHSRYLVGLVASTDERTATVQAALERIFRQVGLPDAILADHGSPWGTGLCYTGETVFTVWLLRLGVAIIHGRPRHPQTQGKIERLHRTLQNDLLRGRVFGELDRAQAAFDRWRHVYNHERPHQTLGDRTPASHYRPSGRSFPDRLAPVEYDHGETVRTVQITGEITYRGRDYPVGKAFRGHPVAIRATDRDGVLVVYFLSHQIATIDLHIPPEPAP